MPDKSTTIVRRNAPFALLAALGMGAQAQTFTPLLDGSLDAWSIENAANDNIRLDNDVVVVGAAPGWLKSDAQFDDFILRLEFRFLTDDADSGIFVRALAEGTFGPGWPNKAYQVQLRNPIGESRFPPVGGIFRHGLPNGETDFDPTDAARLSRGTGVWQTLQIEVRDDALSVSLNDEPLTRATGIVNPSGYIGIQAETGQLEFRAIEIAPLGDSTRASDPDPERFAQEIGAFAAWDRKNTPPQRAILFVGSSSIRRWDTAAAFPRQAVINRGFGGSHISDVNHHYARVVAPYRPQTIVFYAGDNDIGSGKSPERVLTDFQQFARRVQADWPDTHILFLSIKPSFARWEHWPTMVEANRLVARFIDEHANMTFVDMAAPLLGPDGQPKDVFVEDGLHLNDTGNRLWQQALLPHLASD